MEVSPVPWETSDNDFLCIPATGSHRAFVEADRVLPLGRIALVGRRFPCPQDVEGYLLTKYGYLGEDGVYDPQSMKWRAP